VSQPINLNKVRKARAQQAKKVQADANAAAFGRTRAQRRKDAAAQERVQQDLDGKHMTPSKDSTRDADN